METTSAYLGRGLSYPLVLTNGSVVVDDYEALIKHSLEFIVGWEYGTRFFFPTFGSRLWELQGEPNDGVLVALVKRFLLDAVNSNESRISILEVAVSRPKNTSINIYCRYKINATRKDTDFNFQFNI